MSVNVVSACEHMVQTSQPFLAGVTLVVHGKHLSVLGCFGIGSLSGPSTHLDQVNQSYHILNCLVDQCLSTYLASTFISGHPTPGVMGYRVQPWKVALDSFLPFLRPIAAGSSTSLFNIRI